MLMKRKIDELVATDSDIQKLLTWAKDKSISVEVNSKIAAIRAFYLSISLNRSLSFSSSCSLYRSLDRLLSSFSDINLDFNLNHSLDSPFDPSLNSAIKRCKDRELKKILEKLQQQFPNPEDNLDKWNQWWKINSVSWTEELRKAVIEYRNIGHEWNFNQRQIRLLDRYLIANQLLVDCLRSECYVSREVREEIENTLLLPFNYSNHKLLWFY